MRARFAGVMITILATTGLPTPSRAADDAAVRRDLFTVITLQGLPCGEVTEATTEGENDHVATCRDGNRYHVFLSKQGRVVVERQ